MLMNIKFQELGHLSSEKKWGLYGNIKEFKPQGMWWYSKSGTQEYLETTNLDANCSSPVTVQLLALIFNMHFLA